MYRMSYLNITSCFYSYISAISLLFPFKGRFVATGNNQVVDNSLILNLCGCLIDTVKGLFTTGLTGVDLIFETT